ncbi:GNAT family N-acetyltransferase [Haloglomus litoreum]|uniref:GNAT family N-acetyltransferase n=1 Tax=Haloglomus litoreum TaxID=3034026 RepID=UPI0023E79A11|nr:GNAT family N-acetyltransferase [Haloglomus sp. DT116]
MSGDPAGAPPDAAGSGIRTASEADLPRLLAIQAAAFPDPHRALLRSGVRAGLALVALDGPAAPGEPGESDGTAGAVGAVGTGVTGPEVVGYALFTVDEPSVYVAELAVAPGHRRRGHGGRLLAALAARHTGCERLRLTTRVDNDDARAFYASLGFREVRELPGYYDGGEGRDGARDAERADRSDTGLGGNGEDDTNAGSDPNASDDADASDGSGENAESTDGVLLVRDLE